MKKQLQHILVLGLLLVSTALSAKVIYVNNAYTGGTKDGTSWVTPFTELNTAVQSAAEGDELWIAKGTYMPTAELIGGTSEDFRPVYLQNGIKVYGGFVGTESSIEGRDWEQNRTVLTDDDQNNSHPIFCDTVGVNLVFDGLEVKEAYLINQSKGNRDTDIEVRNVEVHHSISPPLNVRFSRNCLLDNINLHHNEAPLLVSSDKILFINSLMENNTVSGFIGFDAKNIEISNNIFMSNNLSSQLIRLSSLGGGGGVINFKNNEVKNNHTIGTFFDFDLSSKLVCKGVNFEGNTTEAPFFDVAGSASGKPIFIFQDLTFKSNTFLGANDFRISLYRSCEFNNVSFIDNTCSNVANGGWLIEFSGLKGSQIDMNGVDFKDNILSQGVIKVLPNDGVTVEMKNSKAIRNELLSEYPTGALIKVEGIKSVDLDDMLIEGNKSLTTGSYAPSLVTSDAIDTKFTNTKVIDNIIDGYYLVKFKKGIILNSNIQRNELRNGVAFVDMDQGTVKSTTISSNIGEASYFIRGVNTVETTIISNNRFDGIVRFLSLNENTDSKINNSIVSYNEWSVLQNPSQSLIYMGGNGEINNTQIVSNYSSNCNQLFNFLFDGGSITNSTIVNNTIQGNITYRSNLNYYNTIIWGNNFSELDFKESGIKFSNIQTPVSGEGNLSVDPEFVDPQNGDFRLSCTSPLLNKGSNEYAPAGTDPNGVPRISGGVVDMGAYEFDGDPAVVNALPVLDFSLAGTSCQAKGLTFTNTTPNKSYFKYNWNFGDQSPLSSEESPAHTYTQDGTYAVEMTATNGCGKSVTKTKDITVVPSAVPTIEHATTICSKDTVTFTTPVSCTNRNWSVTEGTILSGQNTNQIEVAFGEGITQNGAVKLNATNCGGNVACEFPLEVEIPIIPTSIDVVGDLVACPSTAITYKIKNQKTIAGLLYTWSVTGGTITSDKAEGYNLQEVEVVWDDATTAGTLTVATTYELIEECVATVTKNITVKPKFLARTTSDICGNSTRQLSTDKGTDFVWAMESAGGTTVNATGLVTATNTPGVYKVWVTANQSTLYCNTTDTVSITINEKPTLDGIAGETVVDTISNYTYTPIHSYGDVGSMSWSVNGGQQISSSDEQLIAKFNQIEPFSVTGTYGTAEFCSSDPVTLNLTKDLVFKISGPTSGCVGDEVVFSLNNDTETGLTYSWTFDGQEAGLTASTGTIKLTGSGNKVLEATITKGNKTYSATKIVNVQALSSNLILKGNHAISSSGGGTYKYIVNNPDNLALAINIEGETSHTFTKDSVLTVTWNTVGPYRIEVTGEKLGQVCKTVPRVLVITKATALVGAITQSGSSNLCLNENTTYGFNSDQYTENVEWSLSGGGTITESTSNNATVNWSSTPGAYTLSVNYDRFGPQVVTKQIIINPLPNPTIADATVCGELQTPLSTVQNYSTYSWSKESDDTEFSTLASPFITEAGYYQANVTDANGCKGVTSKFIDFVPLPNAEISNTGAGSFCEENGTYSGTLQSAFRGINYNYQWYKNGQVLAGETVDQLSISIDKSVVINHTYGLKITSGVCEQNASNLTIPVHLSTSNACDGSNGGGGGNTCTENVNFTVNGTCQPFSFTNLSSQASGFTWNFGDGTTSTDITPSAKTYATAGVKSIQLAHGTCARKTIRVEVPVQALFTVQDVVCQQQTVTFNDLSLAIASSGITSWKWNFGDNTPEVTYTTAQETIDHTYTADGVYNITLTVEGNNSDGVVCAHTYTVPVKVNKIPVTTIQVTAPSCNDNLFSFGPSNTSLLRYSWDLSGGKTSSALTPSLRYTTYGSKTIQLTVKDATECSNTISTTITVTEPVSPSPITTPVGEDLYLCEGETLTLTSPLSTGTYKWYKDGEQITGTSRTLEADAGGVYSAEYATSGCTLQSETITIGSFDPQVTIEPEGALCLGSQGKLTVTPSSAYTVNWKKDNSLLTTQGTTLLINELTTSNNGDYVAILTEKQTGCIVNTTPFTLTGGTIPTSPSITSLSRGVCYEGGTKVYSSIAINTGLTKKWSNNNSDLGVSTDTLTLANLVQDHNIQLEVIDEASGCAAISSVLGISVRKKESISLSSPNQLCEYKSLSIKTNKSGADFDFEWYREGVKTSLGGASAEIATVAVADSGDYYVVATSKYPIPGCVITSDTTNVKIVGGPDYPVISGDTTFCEGESVTLSTTLTNNFVWNTTDIGKELKVYQAGTYNITVTDPETGCASRTSQKITEYPLPNLGFVGTGTYERCVTNSIEFDGLASFPYYQWKRNGENVGKENTAAFPRLSGKYTVEAKTAEGCRAESDTLRITSTFCGACEVITASDDLGVGSLRDAIYCANAKEGLDIIVFNIPGDGEHIIQLDSALPVIKGGVVINGFSQAKEGVYNIKLQANTYTGTGFEFAFGSEGSDVTGMNIKGFDKGIYFGSNAEETHIISNKIEAKKVGIEFSNGGTDGLIKKNILTTSSTLAKAIVLAKANATTVEANTITGFSEAIIALEADEVEVKENTITTTTRGVNAIAIGGDENKTTSNNISNYANGIYVAIGPSNTLSQNILTNNTQAIDVEIGANGDKTVPTIVTNILDGNNYIVSGTAEEGDLIELFLSDNNAQHTISYINKTTTNTSGVWTISIPKAEAEAFAHKHVVATATGGEGNTSELSNLYKLILLSDVSCTVENIKDSGIGSLRDAINLANAGFCKLIDFKISDGIEADTIVVTGREIEITRNGITIDGGTESGYQDGSPSVYIKGSSTLRNKSDSLTITRLGFNGGVSPVIFGSIYNTNTVSKCYFLNTRLYSNSGCNNDRIDSNIFNGGNIGCVNPGDGLKIRNNIISGTHNGILLDQIRDVEISNNTIGDKLSPLTGFGVFFDNAINITINDNIIQYNKLGGVFSQNVPSDTIFVLRNTIVKSEGAGIEIPQSFKNVTVKHNYVGTNAAGDSLPNTKSLVIRSSGVIIEGNTIGYNTSGGIELTAGANSTFIRNNYIGTNAAGDEMPNGSNALLVASDNNRIFDNTIVAKGIGIEVYSENNLIQNNYLGTNALNKVFTMINPPYVYIADSNNRLVSNTITGSNYVGVSVGIATNLLSQNKIFNNGNSTGSGRQAIYSIFRDKPEITTDDITNGLILSGSATDGDSVEVFLSNSSDQNALEYIETVKAVDGVWSLSITDQYSDTTKNNYYVATATNPVDYTTSELSDTYKVGDLPETCIVTNVQDVGDGSFRDAVATANAGNCNQIHFNIPGNGTKKITLGGTVTVTAPNGIEIDGATQPTGDSIVLTGNSIYLEHQAEAVLNKLVFRNQNRLVLQSDSVTVTNSQFENTQLSGLFSSSELGDKIEVTNCLFNESSAGVDIKYVNNVIIDTCTFSGGFAPISLNNVREFKLRSNDLKQTNGGRGVYLNSVRKGSVINHRSQSNSGLGLYLNDGDTVLVDEFIHTGGTGGIYFNGSNSLTINKASIKHVTGNGISVFIAGGRYIKIDSSLIVDCDRGMYLDMDSSSITNCIVDSCSNGIRFFNNQGGVTNSVITNNRVTNFGALGMSIGQGRNVMFENNVVGNGNGSAFYSIRSHDNLIIRNNFIGVDRDGTAIPVLGNGILHSPNGQNNDIIEGNIIGNTGTSEGIFSAGIYLTRFLGGKIIRNTIVSNSQVGTPGVYFDSYGGKMDLSNNSISGYKTGVKLNKSTGFIGDGEVTISKNTFTSIDSVAIDLVNGANNNKQAPQGLTYSYANNNYIISGTSVKKDTIEIFLNDSLPQHALEYLFTSVADADGNWSITMPEATFNSYSEDWFVATATDTLGNTSELSLPYQVEVPSCTVINTEDSGKGSLRKAIEFANRGFCKVIDFKISEGIEADTIKLVSNLPPITEDSVTINGTTESGYAQGKPVVWLKDKNNSPVLSAIIIGNNNITINGLGITDFNNGVLLGISDAPNQKYGMIKNSVFRNNINSILSSPPAGFADRTGLQVFNNIIDNNKRVGISISASDSVLIESNVIISNDEEGILLNGANFSKIKNNFIGVDNSEDSLPNNSVGIRLLSNEVLIENNVLGYHNVNIDIQGTSNVIKDNYIGVTKSGKKIGQNAPNIIIKKPGNVLYHNTIANSQFAGVIVSADSNKVSENIFINNLKAIDLGGVGNNNKQAPQNLTYTYNNGIYTISGTSVKKDTIEIFLNDSLPQHALEYLYTVVADDNGKWTKEITLEELKALSDNWFVTTATDTSGNTSELSSTIELDVLPENGCIVTTTDKVGAGSLVSAIEFANKGFCPVVSFDVSPTSNLQDTIEVSSQLFLTKDGVVINGESESGAGVLLKGIGGPTVTITGESITVKGLTFDAFYQSSIEAEGVTLTNNKFQNSIDYAFTVTSTKAIISNNSFTNDFGGLKITGNDNTIQSNVYVRSASANIDYITVSGNQNTLKLNTFGSKTGEQSDFGNSMITVTGTDNTLLSNTYQNALGASVSITGTAAKENTISQSIFDSVTEAIVLSGGSNNNKEIPDITSSSASNQSFGGTAVSGDKIEIFANDGRKATNALKYIGFATVGLNDEWTFTIPDEDYDDTKNNYYVATATDTDGNTSELSKVIRVGDKPIFCYVTSVADTGVGTFRRAVDCINDAGLNKSLGAKVIFELPTGRNEIPVLNEGFKINNEFGVDIDANGFDITLVDRNNNLPFAFNWSVSGVKVNKLELNDFDKGFELAEASNTTISNTTFKGVDIAIENTKATNVTLSGNIVENATTALKLNTISSSTVSGNTFRKVGLSIENAKSTNFVVTQNTIAGGTKGITLEGMNNLTIRNNSVEVTGQGIVIDTVETLIFKDNQKLKSETGVVVDIKNASLLTISGNTLAGGTKGFVLTNSEDGIFIGNKLDSVTQKGIELINTDEINFTQNTANGLADLAQAIDLNYEELSESNNGISPPKLTIATYKNRKLILRGKTEIMNGVVELFTSDSIGADLITYVEKTTADDFGDFEFQLDVEPTKINDNHYRATVTASDFYLEESTDRPHTSEASPTFYPNLKVCFVTKGTDQNIEGTVRYNIGLANKSECNLMLFLLEPEGEHTITVTSDLPNIWANNLTIDATSQAGYNGVPVIKIKTNNSTVEHAFVIDSDTTNFALHGIEIEGFTSALDFRKAVQVENTESFVHSFSTNAVTFKEMFSGKALLTENIYVAPSEVESVLHLTQNSIEVHDNILRGGNKATLYIASDTNRITENQFENTQDASVGAIQVESTDSNYIRENIIEGYRRGVVSNNDRELIVIKNEIVSSETEQTGVAIFVDSCIDCRILANIVSNSADTFNIALNCDTALVVSHSTTMEVSGNHFTYLNELGMFVSHSDETMLNSNFVNSSKRGVQLDSSKGVVLDQNTLYNHSIVGVFIDSASINTTVTRNNIGSQGLLDETDKIEGVGIVLFSDNNIIGGVSDTLANEIANNKRGGIHVMGSTGNLITHNRFWNNDTDPDGGPFIHKAILHIDSGNVAHKAPVIITFEEVTANSKYNVFGEATPNDSIHVYFSDGYYQNAKQFVGKGITNGDGKWTVEIDTTTFDKPIHKRTLSIVATATDVNGNTSEFSEVGYVGTCYIVNNKDNANNTFPLPHSFRQAVECVNRLPFKDSLVNAIDGSLGDGNLEILLAKEMLTLDTKEGVVFNAKNIKNNLPLQINSNSTSAINRTFWSTTDSTKDVYISNLEIKNYKVGLELNADTVVLEAITMDGIIDTGIKIKTKATNYVIDSLEFRGHEDLTADFIIIGDSSEHISILNNSIKAVKKGLEAKDVFTLLVEGNKIEDAQVGMNLSRSIVEIKENAIQVDSLNSTAIVLDSVKGAFVENKITKKHRGTPILISNTDSITVIENTISMDSMEVALKLLKVTNSPITKNTFTANTSILFEECDSLLVFKNTLNSFGSSPSFDFKLSEQVKVSQNIIKARNIAYIIDLHRERADSVSNNKKKTPTIDRYGVELIGECTDSNRVSIYLYGTAEAKDSIELFISDTILRSFDKYVITGQADELGNWRIKVPKKVYERERSHLYSFIVTATDSTWHTSQESAPIRFDSVVNELTVTSILDAGAGTLREAIKGINCSDIHTEVDFEIDLGGVNVGPYEIVLADTFPTLSAWRGFTIKPQESQQKFLTSKALEIDYTDGSISKVIVNASAIDTLPVFTLMTPDTDGWGTIEGLSVTNADQAFLVKGAKHQLNRLDIVTTDGLIGVSVDTTSEVLISESTIEGYQVGARFTSGGKHTFVKNELTNNKVGIQVARNAEGITVKQNYLLQSDSISIWLDHLDKQNIVESNVFGTPTSPIEQSGIVLEHCEAQIVTGNYFPLGVSILPDTTLAFITIADSSHNNQVLGSRIGMDSLSVVGGTSNMIGVLVKPFSSVMPLRNNVVNENEIIGLSVPAVVVKNIEGGSISANFIGVDSIYLQKGEGEQATYENVRGIDTTGIVVDSAVSLSVVGNDIINYRDYGVDVRHSTAVLVEKNVILSDKTANKAIMLNIGTPLKSNLGLKAPVIDTNIIESKDRIRLEGKAPYPNVMVQIYEGHSSIISDTDSSRQSLRFVKNVFAGADSSWVAIIPTRSFGFTKFNKYTVQTQLASNSSEYGPLYITKSSLCLFKDQAEALDIRLTQPKYEPCPSSQFEIIGELDQVEYSWVAKDEEFETITEQIAPIGTSAHVTMKLTDDFGCSYEEEFDVLYKDTAQQPEFLVSSNTFVGDTIKVIDISVQETGNESVYNWSSSAGLYVIPPKDGGEESEDGNVYPTGNTIEVIAPEEGKYTINQRSVRSGCFINIQKEIKVTYKDSEAENPYALTADFSSLHIYPSPTVVGEPVSIDFTTTDFDEVYIAIIALDGTVVYENDYVGAKRYSVILEPSTLPDIISGLYMVRLRTKTSVLTERVFINK